VGRVKSLVHSLMKTLWAMSETRVAASPTESRAYRIRDPTCDTRVAKTASRPPTVSVGRSTCSATLEVPSISSTPTVKVTVSPTVRSSTPGAQASPRPASGSTFASGSSAASASTRRAPSRRPTPRARARRR
jgi:hypothetical protein